MRGHLVECYIILILQHRYVLRFRDMKRHRTFWGEGLCSVVWRLGERSGSHGWKGVGEMRLMKKQALEGRDAEMLREEVKSSPRYTITRSICFSG